MRKKPLQSGLLISTALLLLLTFTVVPALIIANQNQRVQFAEKARRTGLENELSLNVSNGQWQSGLDVAEELLQDEPQNLEWLDAKLRCLNALGQRQRVVKELRRIEDQSPKVFENSVLMLWKGDSHLLDNEQKSGVKILQLAIEANVLKPADRYYAQALLSSSVSEITELLKKSLAEDPSHHRATTFLFSTLLNSGRLAEAENHVELALAKFPNDPNLWIMKLMVHVANGKKEGTDAIQSKVVELGGEHLRKVTQDIAKQYSIWPVVMDSWEAGRAGNPFQEFMSIISKLGDFQQDEPRSARDWEFDNSFVREPLAWKSKQRKLRGCIQLAFFGRFKMAADQMVELVDEQSTADELFLIGQSYFLADQYLDAAKYLDLACQRPSRFKNVDRESNWGAAMCYASLWLKDKENLELIKKGSEFARRHLEFAPIHHWHEANLAKIACRAQDFDTAHRYLQRIKTQYPESNEIPGLESRVFAIATAPVAQRIAELSTRQDKSEAELTKEIEAYQSKMIEQIRKETEAAKNSLKAKPPLQAQESPPTSDSPNQ